MADDMTFHRPALGILLKLSALVLFTIMAAIIKYTADQVPPGEAVFFRSLFAMPVIFIWLAMRGDLSQGVRVTNPWGHVRRGVLGTTAMGLNFWGLGLLPLPEVTAIGFAAPIFTLIFAAILLGERIRMIRITAVVIGLVGVTIILWPRLGTGMTLQDGATFGAILILTATLARSLVQIQIRELVKTEHTAAVVFWFSMTATCLSLLTLPFGWVWPSAETFALLVLAGLGGGVAQILVTSSFRFAPASLLAPYDYMSMLFAIALGYVWFGDLPTMLMLAGATLVVVGNAVVIWRERQLGLNRGKARQMSGPKG
jgi:drug/metabolite transporter (DMT)-like permease